MIRTKREERLSLSSLSFAVLLLSYQRQKMYDSAYLDSLICSYLTLVLESCKTTYYRHFAFKSSPIP